MDTIQIYVNGHDVSFSSKALTIDDKVYLYTGISAIKHSSAKKLYLFKYEDSWHKLPYEEKDYKKIATIFKRVAEMNARRAAKSEAPSQEEKNTVSTETEEKSAAPEAQEPQPVEAGENPVSEQEQAESLPPQAEEEDGTTPDESRQAGSEEAGSQGTDSEDAGSEDAHTAEAPEGDSEELSPEALRKKRLKKAFGVLAIIIALFIMAGVAYFFIFGTSNDASQSPNTDSTHEYNDIDELIDEMNE